MCFNIYSFIPFYISGSGKSTCNGFDGNLDQFCVSGRHGVQHLGHVERRVVEDEGNIKRGIVRNQTEEIRISRKHSHLQSEPCLLHRLLVEL